MTLYNMSQAFGKDFMIKKLRAEKKEKNYHLEFDGIYMEEEITRVRIPIKDTAGKYYEIKVTTYTTYDSLDRAQMERAETSTVHFLFDGDRLYTEHLSYHF